MSSGNVQIELERSAGMSIRKVSQDVLYSEFTDGGGADGTLALRITIPAGSFVIGSKVNVKTGFTGDTTAVMNIGDGSDDDKFSFTTHNIFTAADNLLEQADAGSAGTDAGFALVTSDATVTLTASGGSDWGAVSAGRLIVDIFYLSTNVKLD
jgi:hypothetical protein